MPEHLVRLVGGPAHLPREMTLQTVENLDVVVKLPYLNGYEHFSYSGEDDVLPEGTLPRYVWVGRTKIAE